LILVIADIRAMSQSLEEVLRHSQDHVARSRTEPGCLAHAVHRDTEDPLRLVFVERWESREALAAHFAVPGSNQFITAIQSLIAEPPSLRIYEAEDITASMLPG